jgi:hypothetical protein
MTRVMVWLPGLVVALGAAVATVHGLYEVAAAAGVPGPIAWLYPLITDGLALVAYTATARLSGPARRYAWMVVALAAGLSGLAQAAYLAGAPDPTAAAGEPPVSGHGVQLGFEAAPALRFGVGAWPAIAAAIVAHLLYLLAVDHPDSGAGEQSARTPAPVVLPGVTVTDRDRDPLPEGAAAGKDATIAAGVGVASGQAGRTPPAEPLTAVSDRVLSGPASSQVSGPVSGEVSSPVSDGVSDPAVSDPGVSDRPAVDSGAPARDRARAAALAHYRRTGALPSVRELTGLAEVSRGTAADALKTLRAHPRPLHLITDQDAAAALRQTKP